MRTTGVVRPAYVGSSAGGRTRGIELSLQRLDTCACAFAAQFVLQLRVSAFQRPASFLHPTTALMFAIDPLLQQPALVVESASLVICLLAQRFAFDVQLVPDQTIVVSTRRQLLARTAE